MRSGEIVIFQTPLLSFFSRICQHTGIKNFCFHDLRHEAASRIAPYVTTAVLAKIMGWKSIQMAMRYYNPTAEELVAAIRGAAKASGKHNAHLRLLKLPKLA